MNFNEFIKEARAKNKLTQEQAADKLGVSVPTIQNWENNRNKPGLSMLSTIAKEYDLDLDSLIKVLSEDTNLDKDEEQIQEFPEWVKLFPNAFDMDSLKKFYLNEKEQNIFLAIALNSRFEANPIPDILKIEPNYLEADIILDKLSSLNLYTFDSEYWKWYSSYEAEGTIYSTSYWLTKKGAALLQLIKENHGELFNIYKCTPKELLSICNKLNLNLQWMSQVNVIGQLVTKKEVLLNNIIRYDDGSEEVNSVCREIDYHTSQSKAQYYIPLNSFNKYTNELKRYDKRELLEDCLKRLDVEDFYEVIEYECDDEEYLIDREAYLKKKDFYEKNKELIEGVNEPKEVPKKIVQVAIPTQKAYDLIELLK